MCNSKSSKLAAHHAIPFTVLLDAFLASYPMLSPEHDMESLAERARHYKPLWNKKNGITVCSSCHSWIHGTRKVKDDDS